jgi:tetratricopeptide (TPR) repeat protein
MAKQGDATNENIPLILLRLADLDERVNPKQISVARRQQADDFWIHAIATNPQSLRENLPKVIGNRNMITLNFAQAKDFKGAEQEYKGAQDILKRFEMEKSLLAAQSTQIMGDMYFQNKRYDDAKKVYESAFLIYSDKPSEEDRPRFHQMMRDLSYCLLATRHYDECANFVKSILPLFPEAKEQEELKTLLDKAKNKQSI